MERYLLLARSVTHAQQMLRVLDRAGIRTRVLRAGAELTGRGCGYTVEVPARSYAAAIRRLQDAQVKPVKIIRRGGAEEQGIEG